MNIITRIMTKPQNSIEFDSPEESEFYAWCEEAKAHGIIESFEYQPKSFVLSDRVSILVHEVYYTKVRNERKERTKERFVFHPHSYTPDFRITPVTLDSIPHPLIKTVDDYWIDVKGAFSLHNDEKPFSINQKWMYQRHGIVINKVVPDKFFLKTWVPEFARYTPKTGKLRKKYENARTIKECLREIQANGLQG